MRGILTLAAVASVPETTSSGAPLHGRSAMAAGLTGCANLRSRRATAAGTEVPS
jgi:hypothetical protein